MIELIRDALELAEENAGTGCPLSSDACGDIFEHIRDLLQKVVSNAEKVISKQSGIEVKEDLNLDRAIAGVIGLICTQRVLGSDIEFYADPRAGTLAVPRTFKPSTNLNDAFYAAEVTGLFTVVRDGPEVHLAKTIDGQWEILTGGAEMGYITREATPAVAICAAILKCQT